MWSPCCKLFYIKIGSEDFKSRFSIEFYKEDRYIFGGNIFFKELDAFGIIIILKLLLIICGNRN